MIADFFARLRAPQAVPKLVPLVVGIGMKELWLRSERQSAIVITFLDDEGNAVAESLSDVDALDAHGRACIALATAIRSAGSPEEPDRGGKVVRLHRRAPLFTGDAA